MEPSEPPPPYSDAAAPTSTSSSTSNPLSLPPHPSQDPSRLHPPHKSRSGIPPADRRSMEDESRPLPPNWTRQYDHKTHHQFFVNTSTNPPRSIWHHPYDDDQYMSTLSSHEREQIQNQHKVPTNADIEAESSADDDYVPAPTDGHIGGVHKFGRKMKDKLTSSTHEQREVERRRRDEEDARLYRQHQHIRTQMSKAAETGEPQFLGTDHDGKEVYVEPPQGYQGSSMYGPTGYSVDPYGGNIYGRPNARYLRPETQYGRPYGYGYGGGMGMPMMGLGGGMLLGGMMF